MYRLIFILIIGLSFGSCKINSSIMLKTDREQTAALTPPPDSLINNVTQYILGPSDIIQFRLFTNKGWKAVDNTVALTQGQNAGANRIQRDNMNYLIEADSTIKFPGLGDSINLVGKTLREAEKYLENVYSKYYVEPFVQLKVQNKRAIVFPGNGGNAKIIPLINNNTTLMEVLGAASGISERGQSKVIKLIRTIEGERKVFLIDLSTIEGLKYADMIIQSRDYIYIEPRPEIAREILNDVTPIVTIVTSAILLYSAFKTFNQ